MSSCRQTRAHQRPSGDRHRLLSPRCSSFCASFIVIAAFPFYAAGPGAALPRGGLAGISAPKAAAYWPAVVGEALAYARPRTSVPLEAPEVWPEAGAVPNSAKVRAIPGEYSVTLYHCPSPLGVNHPGIGVGTCGDMASYYGYFGGQAYVSPSAARASLSLGTPTCPHKALVKLAAGQVATVYSGPSPQGDCEATWQEGHWSFVLSGDLSGGTQGNATVPWRQVASEVVSYLRGRSLSGAYGHLSSDIAADGLHTVARWQVGRYVYTANTYHGAIPALALVMSMSPYPRP